MTLTSKLIRHPRTTIALAALTALCARAGDTNKPTASTNTAEPVKPIKLLSMPQPQWRTVYIMPATVGIHLPAVRVGTNIVPNVLLVVADKLDIERLAKQGYQAGQADIEVIQQVR